MGAGASVDSAAIQESREHLKAVDTAGLERIEAALLAEANNQACRSEEGKRVLEEYIQLFQAAKPEAAQPEEARAGSNAADSVDSPEAAASAASSGAVPELTKGQFVCLCNLLKVPELNGRTGTVVSAKDGTTGRYEVRLADGSIKSLRGENLVPATETTAEKQEAFRSAVLDELELWLITPPEVREAAKKLRQYFKSPKAFKGMWARNSQGLFQMADADKDGALNSEEWKTFMDLLLTWQDEAFGTAPRLSEDQLRRKFEAFDLDGTGHVTWAQFERGMVEQEDMVSAIGRDPVPVEVCSAVTGDVLCSTTLEPLSMPRHLLGWLERQGYSDFKLLLNGIPVPDRPILPQVQAGKPVVFQYVKLAPAPKPTPKATSSSASRKCGAFQGDGIPGESCFSADSIFVVALAGGQMAERKMADLRVGDMLATGADQAEDWYRRITRIWPSKVVGGEQAFVELSAGCFLTPNHPAWVHGRWERAGSLVPPQQRPAKTVYGLELEGHVDTVLVGGVLCAALGIYCGPAFGWNIFTRKTTWCDKQPCSRCKSAVDPGIDFSSIQSTDLEKSYEPY